MADVPKNNALERAAESAFMELLEGAAGAAGLPSTSKKSLKLAIAAWSLVHGYSTLRVNGALDFLKPRQIPPIQSVVQFVNFRRPRTMARKSAASSQSI
jgi:Tetracyclin repressor-like, C-terminal domain